MDKVRQQECNDVILSINLSLVYLLMGTFCYCLGSLGDPVYEQLHSEFQEQETRNNKRPWQIKSPIAFSLAKTSFLMIIIGVGMVHFGVRGKGKEGRWPFWKSMWVIFLNTKLWFFGKGSSENFTIGQLECKPCLCKVGQNVPYSHGPDMWSVSWVGLVSLLDQPVPTQIN